MLQAQQLEEGQPRCGGAQSVGHQRRMRQQEGRGLTSLALCGGSLWGAHTAGSRSRLKYTCSAAPTSAWLSAPMPASSAARAPSPTWTTQETPARGVRFQERPASLGLAAPEQRSTVARFAGPSGFGEL